MTNSMQSNQTPFFVEWKHKHGDHCVKKTLATHIKKLIKTLEQIYKARTMLGELLSMPPVILPTNSFQPQHLATILDQRFALDSVQRNHVAIACNELRFCSRSEHLKLAHLSPALPLPRHKDGIACYTKSVSVNHETNNLQACRS